MNPSSFPNLTPEQQKTLLQTASQKLNVDPAELENALKSGKFSRVLPQNFPIERYLSDQKAVETALSDPKAQAIIKKLMGGR